MTLLDRFRAQPRQKHPDPTVRLAFVQEIPLDDRELLTEMARDDEDPRVRRAAVAKLMDAVALAGVAKSDAVEDVRATALSMLRDIALEAFEGSAESEGLAAVEALAGLGDAKTLAVVAKSAPSAMVASRARAAIVDPHVLGSIARHGEHESVRREAFDALQDHREILSLALNSEFREPASTAVDRISDRLELEQIANRARNKSASKRARQILREAEEHAAREREEAAAAAGEATRVAQEAALAAANAASDEDRAAREAAAQQAALEREAVARADAEAAQAAAETERAQQAAREQEQREAAEREAERSAARLRELAEEGTRIAAIDDLSAARRQMTVVRREWADLSARTTPAPEAVEQYAAADAAFTARDANAREDDQRKRRDALSRLQHLAARLEPLATRDDLTLKAGERGLRDLRTALGSVPPLPSRHDYEEITQRLKGVQTALTPKVQELRELAGWQRWANVGIQEQLVEKMEALKTFDDPEQIARQVKELQQQWRLSADVPRAQGEVLWKRFKAAHDEVWAKCEAHFASQSEVRRDNLARKTALCERAEALAESTNWIQTADEIKKLQAEWKTIGPVSRGQEKAIWERFRSACDRFFTRRHADLAERKKVWGENVTKKEALIVRAEELAASSDWEPAAAEIKRLQAEWRTVGPVKKSRSEALWLRFRAASDQFFTRYAQRHDTARAERVAAREAIVAELEALVPLTEDASLTEPPAELMTTIRSIRSRWQQELAARGVDRERAAALDEQYNVALRRVMSRWPTVFAGSDLDQDANRRRMEALVKRVEEIANSVAGPASQETAADSVSPTTRLAAMLKEALAANTIGGKVDLDSRLRAAQEEVRQLQSNWSRLGPVPDETRRALADRFQRAIRRIADKAGQQGRAGQMAGVGGGRR